MNEIVQALGRDMAAYKEISSRHEQYAAPQFDAPDPVKAREVMCDDLLALQRIVNQDNRHSAAAIMSHTADERPSYANELKQLNQGIQREISDARIENERRTAAKDDRKAAEHIDGDDVNPKRDTEQRQQEPKSNDEPPKEASSPEKEFVTPETLRKRYLQAENRYHFRDAESTLAFEDHGRRLATPHNDPDVARSMVELAQAKLWATIKLTGTDEFKREAWLQASLRGMDVQGYAPRTVDLARLDDARSDVLRQPARTRATKTATQDIGVATAPRAAVVDEPKQPLSAQQAVAVEAVKAVMRERGDSEKAINMAAEVAAERFQTSRVFVGEVLAHGTAPFENSPKNQSSYYVKMATSAGEKIVWGVDLNRALQEGGVKPGDQIALAYQGRRHVQVSVPDRDGQVPAVGAKEVAVYRNVWDVRQLDAVRDEAKERLAQVEHRGNRQPVVKLYDRDAPRAEPRLERSREPTRRNERSRA